VQLALVQDRIFPFFSFFHFPFIGRVGSLLAFGWIFFPWPGRRRLSLIGAESSALSRDLFRKSLLFFIHLGRRFRWHSLSSRLPRRFLFFRRGKPKCLFPVVEVSNPFFLSGLVPQPPLFSEHLRPRRTSFHRPEEFSFFASMIRSFIQAVVYGSPSSSRRSAACPSSQAGFS